MTLHLCLKDGKMYCTLVMADNDTEKNKAADRPRASSISSQCFFSRSEASSMLPL